MARENENTNILNVMMVNEDTSTALRGKRVSFTGKLGMTRDEMVKFIAAHGGTFDEAPRWGTTYLVTNRDWNKGSTVTPTKSNKLIKAESLGVKIISEKELIDLVSAYQAREAAEKAKTGT